MRRLLPGDVVVLQPGKALFDMVVLQGNCLVTESMLSGEVGHRPTPSMVLLYKLIELHDFLMDSLNSSHASRAEMLCYTM